MRGGFDGSAASFDRGCGGGAPDEGGVGVCALALGYLAQGASIRLAAPAIACGNTLARPAIACGNTPGFWAASKPQAKAIAAQGGDFPPPMRKRNAVVLYH